MKTIATTFASFLTAMVWQCRAPAQNPAPASAIPKKTGAGNITNSQNPPGNQVPTSSASVNAKLPNARMTRDFWHGNVAIGGVIVSPSPKNAPKNFLFSGAETFAEFGYSRSITKSLSIPIGVNIGYLQVAATTDSSVSSGALALSAVIKSFNAGANIGLEWNGGSMRAGGAIFVRTGFKNDYTLEITANPETTELYASLLFGVNSITIAETRFWVNLRSGSNSAFGIYANGGSGLALGDGSAQTPLLLGSVGAQMAAWFY